MKRRLITKENSFNFVEVILIVIVTAIVFSFCTGLVLYNKYGRNSEITSSKEMQEFVEAYSTVIDNYYKDIDKDKLINAAINGMYEYLDDPYTTYLDEDAAESLIESLEGKYQGIGIRIQEQDENVVIKEVIKNTPASESGLLAGDIIMKINGNDVTTLSLSQVTNIIKKGKESVYNIEVKRNNNILNYSVEKKELDIPVVEYKIINNSIGYMNITVFGESAYSQVKEALEYFRSSNISKLIIDLRNNTGGYLDSANNISELFLEKDKLIYTLKEKNKTTNYYDKTTDKYEGKIVVLVNEGTASASEILTGALKYSYGATIVGTKTYGKGKVQQTTKLEDGSMVKYTSSKWYMPNGECVDTIGITPDIIIERTKIESTDSNGTPILTYGDVDEQLDSAIKEMTK